MPEQNAKRKSWVNEVDTMERRFSKSELLYEIGQARNDLNAALSLLTSEQMTGIQDRQGWTVKDHLIHISAWERSVVVFLQGRPRHEGLGISGSVYANSDDDEINAAIQQAKRGMPLDEVLAEFAQVHDELLTQIEFMSDRDLSKANSDFQPEGTGHRDERPISGMIFSNAANHLRDHQAWIETLVTREPTKETTREPRRR